MTRKSNDRELHEQITKLSELLSEANTHVPRGSSLAVEIGDVLGGGPPCELCRGTPTIRMEFQHLVGARSRERLYSCRACFGKVVDIVVRACRPPEQPHKDGAA